MNQRIRNYMDRREAAANSGFAGSHSNQRANMSAFSPAATGHHMMMQEHERVAYQRLADALFFELAPQTELERQLVQKLVDCHTRLNRIPAIESNILNFSLIDNTSLGAHDDATECMGAQARAWCTHANSFEKLGRYEARISRQMLQYTAELERLQSVRRVPLTAGAPQPAACGSTRYAAQNTADDMKLASFCKSPSALSPAGPATPRNAPCPCGSGVKFKRCCGTHAPAVLSEAA